MTLVLTLAAPALAAEWSCPLPAAPAGAEVAPLLYDKRFAYAVEIDDGPVTALTVVKPLLERYCVTDAPPGVAGGKALPFVGGVGVIAGRLNTSNNTMLNSGQLRELRDSGWGILNHSYSHRGRTYGDPPELLSADELRTELFWSQTILASESPVGRATSAFIYPNGYMAYGDHLKEFGFLVGTHVAGGRECNLFSANLKPYDFNRNYLDDKHWLASGKGDPLWSFPFNRPIAAGECVIDFTHGINKDPASPNYQRWQARLAEIEKRFGRPGEDSMWVAPTDTIFEYVKIRQNARISTASQKLTVTIPDDIPGGRVTVRLTGMPQNVALPAIADAAVYRRGDTVWMTTPVIGQPGVPPPEPRVVRVYAGAVKDVMLDAPRKIAAVRVMQSGPVADGFKMNVDLVGDGGAVTSLVPENKWILPKAWGTWLLFNTIPAGPAVVAREVRVGATKSLEQMEIWVVVDESK